MCEDEPPLSEPMCVQACVFGALIYEEREEEVVEEEKQEEIDIGLEALINKYGFDKVKDTLARVSKS
jgi:benzoyl-CoA reductase subunit BamC